MISIARLADSDRTRSRLTMVKRHIMDRWVWDPMVLEALRGLAREAFLPESLHEFAYDDAPQL